MHETRNIPNSLQKIHFHLLRIYVTGAYYIASLINILIGRQNKGKG